MFHCESESTLFGLPKEDTTRNQGNTLFQGVIIQCNYLIKYLVVAVVLT